MYPDSITTECRQVSKQHIVPNMFFIIIVPIKEKREGVGRKEKLQSVSHTGQSQFPRLGFPLK
jgi:hypothetical protein